MEASAGAENSPLPGGDGPFASICQFSPVFGVKDIKQTSWIVSQNVSPQ